MTRRSPRPRSRSRSHGRRPAADAPSVGVISIARKGYAFVDTPEGEYFILRGYLHGAMNGDLVEVIRLRRLEAERQNRMGKSGAYVYAGGAGNDAQHGDETYDGIKKAGANNREMLGSVKRVLERAYTTVIGVVRETDGLFVVIPEDERIQNDFFLGSCPTGLKAKDGDMVVVRITVYPGRLETAQGYIEEIIGHEAERATGMEVVIRRHGLETKFSDAAL
ncbi:MAG: hypothetical protein FWD43_04675, partial [Coriobacteriia bacterium]|nr:hypothetical protein [Coriobacteriia bacterium]